MSQCDSLHYVVLLTFPLCLTVREDSDGHQDGAALLPPTVHGHHRQDVAPGVSAISRDQSDGMGCDVRM